MHYFIADAEVDENNNKVINVKNELNENEINFMNRSLECLTLYKRVKHIYNMVIYNGQELEKYLKELKRTIIKSSRKIEEEKIILQANRLLFNYCSAIGTYIDILEKCLSKIDKKRLNNFRSTCNQLYDNKLEYRFWVTFRNYVIHYDIPFTSIVRTLYETKIECDKERLLKFPKWKHVKEDLEKMNDKIDILPMIVPMNVNLTLLYFDFIYNIADKILLMYENTGKFVAKYKIKKPIIIKAESIEEYKKGKMSMNLIDFEAIQKAFEDVKSHPKINLEIHDITPEWMKN
ncbi:hypothetical protein [Clostridium botulinum]|uniref:hypothetical protein n=1 Tax=Clostridium botulinum TaxID=1491 RepID=UPI0019682A01|nr:hypothetical protein [Clostridium botulinum]MBN1076640.1 hypothetical protein [Clostridium botulinum]